MPLHPFLIGFLLSTPPTVICTGNEAVPVVEPAVAVKDQEPVAEAEKPAPKWTGAVSAGLTATDGNSTSTTAAVDFNAERKAEQDRWTIKAWFNYAAQENASGDNEITQRREGLGVKYDYFLSKKTYLFANAGVEYDLKAGIDLRTIVGGGVGYQFYDTPEFSLAGEVGLNRFDEEFKSGGSAGYMAARLAEKVGWQIRKGLRFDHSIEAFPSVEDVEDVSGKMDNRLSMNLTEKMFAQLQWVMTYDNTPAGGAERVDDLYLLTLGWSF